jgi:hypothetical protein
VTESVLVIGAGPAGLAATAELRRRGVPAEIIEQSDAVASAWRLRYDRLRLNTSRWSSTLSGEPFPKGTPVFPVRDSWVSYLESYVERHDLPVRFGIRVDRIDPRGGGWRLTTSAGALTARHIIVATGNQHTPLMPDWPGLREYEGRLLHSAGYRNPEQFRDADVLVAGAGSSAMDIAYDLVRGGAARVRVSVRSQPHMLMRNYGPLPSDMVALALFTIPTRLADHVSGLVRRWSIGDLAPWGLTAPREGMYTHWRRTGRTPTIVNGPVIEAIRTRRFEIVADISSVTADEVRLADGTTVRPDAIIAATGFGTGLEPIAGHLGVLDARGVPRAFGGPAVAPGLRFTGYVPNIRNIDREARSVAEQVSRELAVTGAASRELTANLA